MPLGRVVFAFNGSKRMLSELAEPSGPRPILLSYYYLKGKNGLEMLEKWRKYSEPWLLILDSGVYTMRGQLGLGLKATSGGQLKDYTKDDIQHIYELSLARKDEIDQHVADYIQFLKDADGLWDLAIEMDMDDWMGVEHSDIYYDQICSAVPKSKVLRVWHQSGRDFSGWEEWCADPDMPYLSMEGGTIHGRDPNFYHRFIRASREAGKKVHILAMTVPEFMRVVDVDTSDSSTFINGGRFGSVKTPRLGEIVFSNRTDLTKQTSSSANHYSRLTPQELEYCVGWFKKYGFTLDEILNDPKSHFYRSLMNIYWFDEVVDVPYEGMPINQSLF